MSVASPDLVAALRGVMARLEADLRDRVASDAEVGGPLRGEYDAAFAAERTAQTWSSWRDERVTQAAAAWVLGTVFVRFCEDNGLIVDPWLSGPGTRRVEAAEREAEWYVAHPAANPRDWLRAAFDHLASFPAAAALFDPRHNPLFALPISADAARGLVDFWRQVGDDGLVHFNFTDPDRSTRFLGDLYQDLSEDARKRYALLQTPHFVEEFLLDRSLTPSMADFGLADTAFVDPTCGSGHLLLGAFDRLVAAWGEQAPGMPVRERVLAALGQVTGVDINPFAVAIARFRLVVAAMNVEGLQRLSQAPAYPIRLAAGDSLLQWHAGPTQGDLLAAEGEAFAYWTEDAALLANYLRPGQYTAAAGNPPYVTVKDKAQNATYRGIYPTCHRQYALSVPFIERFTQLVRPDDGTGRAGYVAQITANSFMKREFGSKLIEDYLPGVDLEYVIDTSGAYIPGHGTPTVILVWQRRHPRVDAVRAVLGVRGEPGQPDDPAKGLVWTQIVEHIADPGFDGTYVSVTDLPSTTLAAHPWSLGGGSASDIRATIEAGASIRLADVVEVIGYTGQTNADEVFLAPAPALKRRLVEPSAHRQVVVGDIVRDFAIGDSDHSLFPYDADRLLDIHGFPGAFRWMWPTRTVTWSRATFAKVTYRDEGRSWWEWHQVALHRLRTPLSLAFAFVATHNHFVLDRGGKVFNRSAPVIKLPAGASVEEHLDLLGVLNSSAAAFWLRQVCHGKGNGGVNEGMRGEDWEEFYEFTGTKLQEFPLPPRLPRKIATTLDALAQRASDLLPAAVVARGGSLAGAEIGWAAVRREMVFWQEELDWWVYAAYGLLGDGDLTWAGDPVPLALGERAFEIALARRIAAGEEESAWFDRHGSIPITEIPSTWPAGYRDLVQRRLDLIGSDPRIGLLERPEYKRRWASRPWDDMARDALAAHVLDRLEDPDLWRSAGRARVLSVSDLAAAVRGDAEVVAALDELVGRPDYDLATELGRLLAGEHVPFLAAYRYKDSGLVKRTEWERVWSLQRREDAGERVSIPVPPKYGQGDFRQTSFWRNRGKLDVPKERFVSYPGAGSSPGDLVLGWAGWDHLDQAQALATLVSQRQTADGWGAAELAPLLAGLVEVEPWLHQWYAADDPAGRGSAAFYTSFVDARLQQLGLTRDDLAAWRPAPAARRGRR